MCIVCCFLGQSNDTRPRVKMTHSFLLCTLAVIGDNLYTVRKGEKRRAITRTVDTIFTEKLMYIWQPNWHLIPWGVLFCLLARINSRVLFLAAKTGTQFHFFS